MKFLPIIIVLIVLGSVGAFFWAAASIDTTLEYNLTLRRCSGDRFSFIQGTYVDPVTEEEMEREKAAVISRVNATEDRRFRAGGSGSGGGRGPGGPYVLDSRTVAWGYCINYDGVPTVFSYGMGNDAPSDHAVEKTIEWYQDRIVNQSLEVNVTCESRTVIERFRRTGMFHDSLVREESAPAPS